MASGSGSVSKMAVWVRLGLLILGLGGFGVTNLSGGIRSIGSVGTQDISIDDYVRGLQQDIRAIEAQTGQPLPLPEAQALGVDRAVLARLVTQAALDHEASSLGISLGDQNLAEQITEIPAFRGASGSFDREAYRFALDRAGLTEAEFEDQIRRENARSLLQGAIVRGTAMPDSFADTILTFAAERRNLSFIRLDQRHLDAPLSVPTEDELLAFHNANLPSFTTPEMKTITYAWLAPDAVIDDIALDETDLRAAYDRRADEFNTPERRLVDRLAFPDAAAAGEALARLTSGAASFETLVTERGLTLPDVDLGDLSRADLGAAAEAVFAAAEGAVVGPVDTPVGPALFRINGVLEAQETSYEDALPLLRDELAIDRARREVARRATDLDGLLASGATLEELGQEPGVRVGTLDWYYDSGEGIANYEGFRRAAQAVTAEDFPKIEELEDGGVFALRLDGIVAPRVLALDEVRADVVAGWEARTTQERLRAQAEAMAARMAEGVEMTALGHDLSMEPGVTRGQFIPGTPPDFLTEVFAMSEGETRVLAGLGAVILVRVDAISPPDLGDPNVAALRSQLTEETAQSLSQDLFQAFAADVQARAGLVLDQSAINAANASFQ